MADTVPNAIARALPLMDAPESPVVDHGYLDLLERSDKAPGLVQALWASDFGSALYDPGQALMRRFFSFTRLPESFLRLPPGGHALDVGSGPGNMTAALGRKVGPEGLALGVDVSEPMLRRAVSAETAPNVGFLRADARTLPFHDASFDVATSLSVLQLIPDPLSVMDEMGRVLVPGGRLALMIPTVRGTLFDRLNSLVGYRAGLRFFEPEEIAQRLHGAGFATVYSRQHGQLLWVHACKK